MRNISQGKLVFLVALFLVIFDNVSFFTNVTEVYPLSGNNIYFIGSLAIVLLFFTNILLTLLSSKYTTKLFLIILVFISALTKYFMNTYSVVIDDSMIQNSLQTNFAESLDLFSLQLLAYAFFLGVIPSYIIYKLPIEYKSFKQESYAKFKSIILSLIIIVILVLSFSKYYTSFFREHKTLRYHTNPTYWMYSLGKYINTTFNSAPTVVQSIGDDAKISETMNEKKELVILVVGEAARADRFSLNGYEKETNPLLKKEDIINFSNVSSCGTSTAVSVPCMFSIFGKDDYDYKKGIGTQNILDVISKSGVEVLWRDNNSDSKGVALRVSFEDYRTPQRNTICVDGECRDIGMLVGLDKFIEKNKGKDILIVLHQMGNHGPAYYKRYPKEFEKFTPVCKTNQLEQCTKEELSNAYDNAILYTDYFLSHVINFLKPYGNTHETAMIYLSDHGESLGENGLYLHGMPYFMAPESQTKVGAMMWFGSEDIKEDVNVDKLKTYRDKPFSQDYLFSTLLNIFEVDTKLYDKKLDILYDATKSQ